MKLYIQILIIVIGSIGFIGVGQAENPHAAHGSHHESEASNPLVLNNGKKWEIDSVMRTNMEKINAGLVKLKNSEKKKKAITAKEYGELHDTIQASTQDIIKNCKMETKMDQAYHVILGEILGVAQDLKNPEKQKEASKVLSASLKKYSEFFNHQLSGI